MRARTARWVPGRAAAAAVALIGGGLALAYLDRHLVPSVPGMTRARPARSAASAARPSSSRASNALRAGPCRAITPNIWPMNPSGVHEARPTVPPGRVARMISFAAR